MNLQSLDEALSYLNDDNIESINEGLIDKFIKWRDDKKKKKALEEKDKKDIRERGYTDKQYRSCKEDLQSYIKWAENKPLNIMDLSNWDLAAALYYNNISESQFVASFNKFAKNINNEVDADDYPFYDEDDPMYVFLRDNEAYEIGDTGGTPYCFYFPKLKKFMDYYNDRYDKPSNAMSYSEFLKMGKDYLTKPTSSATQNQYAKAYIAADKDLGYNKLS